MSRNIVPRINKGSDLGTVFKNWNKLYVDAIILRGNDLKALLDSKTDLETLTTKGDLYVAEGPGAITRLPAGEDGYVLRANSINPKGLDWVPAGARQELTGNVTVTVGNTGDFPTINSALESVVALYYPKYISGDHCPRVTITLLLGFVMSEQVIVESLDLSWITITGVDNETIINRSALTYRVVRNGISLGGFNAFTAINGGFLPIIGQLFNMDQSGNALQRCGIVAFYNSRAIILPGCGVKNAGDTNISASAGSIIEASDADASGAGGNGISATCSSMINASRANVSGAGNYGLLAGDSSIISANSINASNTTARGIIASKSSLISAENATILGPDGFGALSTRGSIINAYGANASEKNYGFLVIDGGIIIATNATGTLNTTANTISSGGIIFK